MIFFGSSTNQVRSLRLRRLSSFFASLLPSSGSLWWLLFERISKSENNFIKCPNEQWDKYQEAKNKKARISSLRHTLYPRKRRTWSKVCDDSANSFFRNWERWDEHAGLTFGNAEMLVKDQITNNSGDFSSPVLFFCSSLCPKFHQTLRSVICAGKWEPKFHC